MEGETIESQHYQIPHQEEEEEEEEEEEDGEASLPPNPSSPTLATISPSIESVISATIISKNSSKRQRRPNVRLNEIGSDSLATVVDYFLDKKGIKTSAGKLSPSGKPTIKRPKISSKFGNTDRYGSVSTLGVSNSSAMKKAGRPAKRGYGSTKVITSRISKKPQGSDHSGGKNHRPLAETTGFAEKTLRSEGENRSPHAENARFEGKSHRPHEEIAHFEGRIHRPHEETAKFDGNHHRPHEEITHFEGRIHRPHEETAKFDGNNHRPHEENSFRSESNTSPRKGGIRPHRLKAGFHGSNPRRPYLSEGVYNRPREDSSRSEGHIARLYEVNIRPYQSEGHGDRPFHHSEENGGHPHSLGHHHPHLHHEGIGIDDGNGNGNGNGWMHKAMTGVADGFLEAADGCVYGLSDTDKQVKSQQSLPHPIYNTHPTASSLDSGSPKGLHKIPPQKQPKKQPRKQPKKQPTMKRMDSLQAPSVSAKIGSEEKKQVPSSGGGDARDFRMRLPVWEVGLKSVDNKVRNWMKSIGLEKYTTMFEHHEVTNDVLPFLTMDDLKEMGVSAVGARRKLSTEIMKLKQSLMLIGESLSDGK